jgi:hypothetical protein
MSEIEKDVCCGCGKEFPKAELFYGPDPYAEDVHNEIVETVLCEYCYCQSCEDI